MSGSVASCQWWVTLVQWNKNFTHKGQISKTYQWSVWIHGLSGHVLLKRENIKHVIQATIDHIKWMDWMYDIQDGGK